MVVEAARPCLRASQVDALLDSFFAAVKLDPCRDLTPTRAMAPASAGAAFAAATVCARAASAAAASAASVALPATPPRLRKDTSSFIGCVVLACHEWVR